MPYKDTVRHPAQETKTAANSPQHGLSLKPINATSKVNMSKQVSIKDPCLSPGAPVATAGAAAGAGEEPRPELLGSLTTLQQQRTSARVIKKLKLEPPVDKREPAECETPNKTEDKDPLSTAAFPTMKQRMPKALWSADEKSLFFEALNEYGKDFDAITSYICAKMKKKNMNDGNLKTKTQVSHFYYRTWHKLSKHVQFDENVKKVAQELYALINYGELRRKLVSVNEKTCARLGEMVRCGSMAVRARGRTHRVRTPMCRALRRLNQISERACGLRVCTRAQVVLRARDAAAWARVQAAAHNPRAAVALPPRAPLAALLAALRRRWSRTTLKKRPPAEGGGEGKREGGGAGEEGREDDDSDRDKDDDDIENHLGLEPDRALQDSRPPKLALHVGPRPGTTIHLPVLSAAEQPASQKICFASYLQRMGAKRDKDGDVKIRTPKRQRKDSVTDKEKEVDSKKAKLEEPEHKLMNIDETAIDGIELMASYKSQLEHEEKPSTEDEKETKAEETAEEEVEREPERDKDMSEREKDSFSEMEDDEKYNKSDTDNESDSKGDKSGKERKFKNLKVKFRIRPKKRGGSVYTLVLGKEDESKPEDQKTEEQKTEDQKAECDVATAERESKPVFDVVTAMRQISNGWSAMDAGDLTIGDLYLMFGSRSKIELDYWWAEPTPPLPQPLKSKTADDKPERDRAIDRREKNRTPDKDSGVEEDRERRESDTDIFSPKNTFSQDSNDGMSGDERKCEQLASPEHKSSGTLKLVNKLINRPVTAPPPDGFSLLGDRLKRLLALAGNTHVGGGAPPARCGCGHVCAARTQQHALKNNKQKGAPAAVFRHPAPIAPKPDTEGRRSTVSLEGLPRWRRGRPRVADRPQPADQRVVVQRLLPLLPEQPNNLIPVKIVSNSPRTLPRILRKPPPTSNANLSCFYVLSDSPANNSTGEVPDQEEMREEEEDEQSADEVLESKIDISATTVAHPPPPRQDSAPPALLNPKAEQPDIANFLPTESLSLSPSRLLHEAEGWLEGAAHDFSLSSFLHTLDARAPDHAVESQLQSLMAESSVDYVAKFADLAAEVTDEQDPLA